MKNPRLSYIVFGIALIVGFIVYSLFSVELLTVTTPLAFFLVTAVIATAILAVFLTIRTKKKEVFCNCGILTIVGAAVTAVLSLILSLVAIPTGTIFFIVVAILFFFIVLLFGGIVCYLYNSNECYDNCRCQRSDCEND